jgi:hypothetical protein
MRLATALLALIALAACSSSTTTADVPATDVPGADVPADVPADVAPDAVDPWADATSYEPGVEKRGNVTVLRLKGTAYEMGKQHGQLMHDQLVIGGQYLDTDPTLSLLEPLAAGNGYLEDGTAQSYDDIREECRGIGEVMGAEGFTYDRCIALAWGDVMLENTGAGSIACSQFIATGKATGGGEMIHGRSLDWGKIDYLLEYPTVIVRHPTGKIPYVVVGFPGNVATYNGINAAGISCGSNQNSAIDSEMARSGRSEIQMMNEMLANATNLEQIKTFYATEERTVGNNIVFADGDHDAGAVFELTKYHMGVREIDDKGIVFVTNHYTVPEMIQYGVGDPEGASTKSRFMRLEELLLPDGKDTLYGTINLEKAVQVLRDRWNPYTQVMAPADQADDQGTISGNACVYSVVFAPKRRAFWLASGGQPIPMNPYQGFTLEELFGKTDAAAPDPVQVP